VPGVWADLQFTPPSRGELLRAMRCRRGLTLAQVAALLRVRHTTVSRWERSATTPDEEQLHALLDLLRALPEERAALDREGWALIVPGDRTRRSLEALAAQWEAMIGVLEQGDCRLADLHFWLWEAQVRPLAHGSAAARELLVRGYTRHGDWLTWDGRKAEAMRYASRALEMLRQAGKPVTGNLAHVLGFVTANASGRSSYSRAIELLQALLPGVTEMRARSSIYRDLADYASRAGELEAAVSFIGVAHDAAERSENPATIRLARFVHAALLGRLEKPHAALDLLPTDNSPIPIRRVLDGLEWIHTLLALGDRSTARVWVECVRADIETFGLHTFRYRVEEYEHRC
jgi:transcriptional regulator with XRE-family HTH domain